MKMNKEIISLRDNDNALLPWNIDLVTVTTKDE